MDTKNNGFPDLLEEYFQRWNQAFIGLNSKALFTFIDLLHELKDQGGTLFTAGNGGSASTAEHFAVDIGIGSSMRGSGIKAIPLTISTSQLTAVSNDANFNDCFALSLKYLKPNHNDALVVFSASGESTNIVQLLQEANSIGMTTCAFTGFLGGEAKSLANINVHVPTSVGEYGVTEDLHLFLTHFVTETFRRKYTKD